MGLDTHKDRSFIPLYDAQKPTAKHITKKKISLQAIFAKARYLSVFLIKDRDKC